jgi:hypothetical protein
MSNFVFSQNAEQHGVRVRILFIFQFVGVTTEPMELGV